ncbi:MAG: sulfatase [Bryobacteraceae bacterium]
MNRRHFLTTAAGALAAARLAPGAARKPNIVVIVSDDHGYAEMGVQGCKDIPTPNLDAMARAGTRFTNGYVSCPVCSPTRAGLMTGRYQQRFGHEFNPGPALTASGDFGLSLNETPLPAVMKSLGYTTGMFGKWHLGYRPEYHPQKRGFDEFFGFLGGAHSYLDWTGDKANPLLRGTQPVDEKTYLTDALAREALAFMDRHRTEPFFVYLPFNAVHAPLQSIEKYLARFQSIQDERRRTFAAMLSAMDDAVGRVRGFLRDSGLEENTLVFFISDNGGPTPSTSSRNDPLRGYKGQVLEGGIRVPYMVQWKGRIPAGKTYDQPVISLDILPTAVSAAGGRPAANLDGVNLLPYLTGKASGRPHDRLYWRFGPQAAIRAGDWKLLRTGGDWELYNLAQDIGEAKNLAGSDPARVKELAAAWEQWNGQLVPPKWVSSRRAFGQKKRKKR